MTAEQRNHMLLCDPVSRVIPKLAVPTIISMLITNIYNMADTYLRQPARHLRLRRGGRDLLRHGDHSGRLLYDRHGQRARNVSQALGAGNREKADSLRLHVVLHGVHRGRHSGVFAA